MTKSWHVVTLVIAVEEEDTLTSLIHDLGSIGLLEEARSESEVTLNAYFESDINPTHVESELNSSASIRKMEWLIIGQQDWNQKCRELFKPFYICEGILIKPTWEKINKGNDIVIEIDPSMAFGTGTHETTQLCAELMHPILKESRIKRVMDLGAGSGILSLIAAKLCDASIVAVENDPTAFEIAKENMVRNRCAARILLTSDLSQSDRPFDLIVANILLHTLKDLSEEICARLKAAGTLILSGILHDQVDSLLNSFKRLIHVTTRQKGEWSALLLKKKF